jgi:hypothetical protein
LKTTGAKYPTSTPKDKSTRATGRNLIQLV